MPTLLAISRKHHMLCEWLPAEWTKVVPMSALLKFAGYVIWVLWSLLVAWVSFWRLSIVWFQLLQSNTVLLLPVCWILLKFFWVGWSRSGSLSLESLFLVLGRDRNGDLEDAGEGEGACGDWGWWVFDGVEK